MRAGKGMSLEDIDIMFASCAAGPGDVRNGRSRTSREARRGEARGINAGKSRFTWGLRETKGNRALCGKCPSPSVYHTGTARQSRRM